MNRFIKFSFVFLLAAALASPALAQDLKVIKLPAPRREGGKPLMQALKERASSREYSGKDLSLQTLSDLLWAGFGINRPDTGKRTAPSARNRQEIDVYLARADGLYIYNAKENSLELVLVKDIREATGKQDFVKIAALNLVYVADFAKMGKGGEQKDVWAALDTGFIAQNVYLFCASEGLATVVRGMFDAENLKKVMKLRPDQKIMLTQTVGYPK
jgi:SagB-type dehydrogenase family enzyme